MSSAPMLASDRAVRAAVGAANGQMGPDDVAFEELKATNQRLRKQLNSEVARHKARQREHLAQQKAVDDKVKKLTSEYEAQIEYLQNESASSLVAMRQELDAQTREAEKARKEQQSAAKSAKAKLQGLAELKAELKAAQEALAKKTKEHAQAAKALDKQRGATDAMEKRFVEFEAELARLEAVAAEDRAQAAAGKQAATDLATAHQRLGQLEAELEAAQGKAGNFAEQMATLNARLAAAEGERDQVRQSHSQSTTRLEERCRLLTEEVERLQQAGLGVDSELSACREQIATLEREKAAAHELFVKEREVLAKERAQHRSVELRTSNKEADLAQNLKEAQAELETLRTGREELSIDLESAQETRTRLDQELADTVRARDELAARLGDAEGKAAAFDALQKELESANEARRSLEAQAEAVEPLKEARAQLEQDLNEARASLASAEAQTADLQSQVAELSAQAASAAEVEEARKELMRELKDARKELHAVGKERDEVEEARKTLETRLSEIEDEAAKLKTEVQSRSKEAKKAAKRADELAGSLAQETARANEAEAALVEAKKRTDSTEEALASEKKRAASGEAKCAELAAAVDEERAARRVDADRVIALESELAKKTAGFESELASKAANDGAEIKQLGDELHAANQELEGARARVAELESAEEELRGARIKAEELALQNERLGKELEAARSRTSEADKARNDVEAALAAAKEAHSKELAEMLPQQELQSELQETRSRLSAAERDLLTLRGDHQKIERELAHKATELQRANTVLREKERDKENRGKDDIEVRKLQRELETQQRLAGTAKHEYQERLAMLEARIDELEQTRLNYEQELAQVRQEAAAAVDAAGGRKDAVEEATKSEQAQAQLEFEIREMRAQLNAAKNEIKALRSEKTDSQSEANHQLLILRARVAELLRDKRTLEGELTGYRAAKRPPSKKAERPGDDSRRIRSTILGLQSQLSMAEMDVADEDEPRVWSPPAAKLAAGSRARQQMRM